MIKHKYTTVEEFFTWYTGEDWRTTYETTATLSIDGLHAEDASPNGKAAMAFLERYSDMTIETRSMDVGNAWLIEFCLQGSTILVQCTEAYTRESQISGSRAADGPDIL